MTDCSSATANGVDDYVAVGVRDSANCTMIGFGNKLILVMNTNANSDPIAVDDNEATVSTVARDAL